MSFFFGKVVIVTGSSNGIGRSTAVLFAKQGAKVTITGRNDASLEETRQLCLGSGAKGEDLLELIGDVKDESFLAKLISTTLEKFGRIDVLVNNAGGGDMSHLGKPVLEIPFSDFDEMFDLNVKPVIRLSQLAVPHLEKTKGSIVNVSSIGSALKISPLPFYAAAKSALDQITIQMAGSLIKKGIRVNSVNPGPVLTNFAENAGASEEEIGKVLDNTAIPLGRIGLAEDIGKIILFLADRTQSEILVGHIVTADGGLMLKSAISPEY